MPMDGMTVGFTVRELNHELTSGRIDRVTQPEKDLMILTIRVNNQNRKLLLCASPNNARCHITGRNFTNPLEPSNFCMLMRKQLLGARILKVSQAAGDRIVHIDLDMINEMGDHVSRKIVLEIMGRHSNLILLDENGRILEAVRHVSGEMNRVREILPGLNYVAPPSQHKMNPEMLEADQMKKIMSEKCGIPFSKALMETVTGLSPVAAEELSYRVLRTGDHWPEDLDQTCVKLAELIQRLPEMVNPHVLYSEDGEARDIFPFPYLSHDITHEKAYDSMSAALEAYFDIRDQQDRMNQKSASMLRLLKTHVDRCEKKLAMQEEELASAQKMDEYRFMGEAINANLYQLKKGMSEARLPDWFSEEGGEITVELDERLSPAQNAQKYFKKYQKARNARQTAAIQKEKTLAELDYLEGMLLDIGKCEGESELEEIRQDLIRTGYMKRITNRKQQRQLPLSQPYRYQSTDGIEILVGKNAAQNDRLTLGAKPDEMWMHAKDMPGSHVIICKEGEIPITTLKEAALLAAWYSKGQQSSLVPIDYTRKRYVKKPSGAAPGKVVYTHYKTAYMTPEEKDIRKIAQIKR